MRVPLIVRFPDAAHAGRRIDTVVSNVDVVPTILDYPGMSVPTCSVAVGFQPNRVRRPHPLQSSM